MEQQPLAERVSQQIQRALKTKDEATLRALRAIKAAIQLALTAPQAAPQLTYEQEIKLLQQLIKQRREAFETYQKAGRNDLAQKEAEEIAVIEQFLPPQLSEPQVRSIVQQIITELGASGLKDMGKVMGEASRRLAGSADNKLVAAVAKELLTS